MTTNQSDHGTTSGQDSMDVKEQGRETAEFVNEEVRGLGKQARDTSAAVARQHAETAREAASDRIEEARSTVSDVAHTLSGHDDRLGDYASEFADRLARLNDRIRTRSLDELAGDARTLYRNNPAMFMLGAVAVGAVAARFFRASGRHASERNSMRGGYGGSGGAFRTDSTRASQGASTQGVYGYPSERPVSQPYGTQAEPAAPVPVQDTDASSTSAPGKQGATVTGGV